MSEGARKKEDRCKTPEAINIQKDGELILVGLDSYPVPVTR